MNSSLDIFDKISRKAIDSLLYAIVVDQNGIITCMSDSYLNLLKKKREEVLGRHVYEVIPNSKLPRVLKTGKEELGELFEMIDGSIFVCNRIPIYEEGSLQGVISTATCCDLKEIEVLRMKIKNLERENRYFRNQLNEIQDWNFEQKCIVGHSEPIQRIKDAVQKIAPFDLPVLITGETGTGKEMIANSIHYLSKRREKKFIKINCAAIPHGLLESELFGYEGGAFSGALKSGKIGKFELAEGGSILLDEIGEMPLELQSKLLRVLQEHKIERIGGAKTIHIDVRVICITNCDLKTMIDEKRFRADLYYRINTVELHVPSLRERISDIPELCAHFIEKSNVNLGVQVCGVAEDVLASFMQSPWRGNIRELENTLERGCAMARTGAIQKEHLTFVGMKNIEPAQETIPAQSLTTKRENLEREEILKTLTMTAGNKSRAAKILGMDRSVLYGKIVKYRIQTEK
ncbi:MAG: sigma 54-interacting transcriptional regulator [Fusobacteriaceae bacterium]|jgi:transcriptional regulator with PAS, ATPase and Fis domain|nr:sigma 54-interacting transcriptional regulator [Fusobacteriaceae bacterium]